MQTVIRCYLMLASLTIKYVITAVQAVLGFRKQVFIALNLIKPEIRGSIIGYSYFKDIDRTDLTIIGNGETCANQWPSNRKNRSIVFVSG